MRSNTSDQFTFGTLTMAGGTALQVDGNLQMNGAVSKATSDLGDIVEGDGDASPPDSGTSRDRGAGQRVAPTGKVKRTLRKAPSAPPLHKGHLHLHSLS